MEELKFRTKASWFRARKKYITGTDCGVICGVSKYKTPTQLWYEKKDKSPYKNIQNKAMKRGTDLEPVLISLFEIDYPDYEVTRTRKNSLYISKEHPFMASSFDGLLHNNKNGDIGFLEIKTAKVNAYIRNSASKQGTRLWGKEGDSIPDVYKYQIAHYFLSNPDFKFAVLRAYIHDEEFDQRCFIVRDYFLSFKDNVMKDIVNDTRVLMIDDLIHVEKVFFDSLNLKTPPMEDINE